MPKEMQTSDHGDNAAIADYFFGIVQGVDQPRMSTAGNYGPTPAGFRSTALGRH